jgi:hypothetical protein
MAALGSNRNWSTTVVQFGHVVIIAIAIVSTASQEAFSRNTPCSGSKGGIARCLGEKFLCNDGSTSASKKMCSMGDTGPDGETPPAKKRAKRQ